METLVRFQDEYILCVTEFELVVFFSTGSPLIVHQPRLNPEGETVLAPFAVGLLARIFGVYDPDPASATCPISFRTDSQTPTIIESFCNLSNVLDWIAAETGLSVQQLTDPFFDATKSLCFDDDCPGRWDAEENDDSGLSNWWHIGFGDRQFDHNHPEHWWIGPVFQNDIHPNSGGHALSRRSMSLFLCLLSFLYYCTI